MNYFRMDKEDVCNGEGLRVVLWLSGCSHKCKGCQNPQTWDANSGIPFDESAKEELFRELDKDYISGLTLTGGDPLFESNLDGVLDLVTEVNKRYNTTQYIDENVRENHNILNENANKIRLSRPKKSIWLYSGYTWKDIFDETLDNMIKDINSELSLPDLVDEFGKKFKINHIRQQIISQCTVLIDGQYIDYQRDITLPYRGSTNQRVIDIQQSLQKGEIVLWQI